MGLSSNSLIHFTNDKEALIGILHEEFKVRYCMENIETTAGPFNFAIPMVSFCDIPMSAMKDHIKKYGSYGIGLTLTWGQERKLNPVLYVDKNSAIGADYRQAFSAIVKSKRIPDLSETESQLVNLVRYMKNYEADLTRAGITIANYRFADEKEWRYVPRKDEAHMVIMGSLVTHDVKKQFNKKIENLRLGFEPKDIKYIIVKEEADISEFIEVLRRSKGTKFTMADVERLMTRIITSEQIFSDF